MTKGTGILSVTFCPYVIVGAENVGKWEIWAQEYHNIAGDYELYINDWHVMISKELLPFRCCGQTKGTEHMTGIE